MYLIIDAIVPMKHRIRDDLMDRFARIRDFFKTLGAQNRNGADFVYSGLDGITDKFIRARLYGRGIAG